jgi:isocitrate dehydrogenase (NAD+)
MGAVDSDKDPMPQRTIDSIRKNRVALKGPLGTPIGQGFRSVNVALRQEFDLYANVRPARTMPGVPSRYENVDVVVVRENTEDIYAGIEHYRDTRRNAAESIAIITRVGSTRIAEYAYEYARTHGRKKVAIVHKANILKMSNGLFLECARDVARKHPEITTEEHIVDACCMKLVVDPTRFDMIVTMNLFGDIISDLTAGLVGGLGVAPAANIGIDTAIFEAVHGTAPDIAGKGLANPTALMLSAAMMLDHLEQDAAAARLRKGVLAALASGETRTRDLGGGANTLQFTDAVIRAMGSSR